MEENFKPVPDEIKGWNWGAFMFSAIWGIGNRTYLPLLTLIPFFNIIWIFVVGFKGNDWAWQNGNYTDVETFQAVQATWNRAGIAQFVLFVIILVAYLYVFITILNVLSVLTGH